MNIQIYGSKKCSDSRKAERYFKERKIKFQWIELPKYGFSPGEFKTICAKIGLSDMIDCKSKDYERSFIAHLAYEQDIIEKLFENPSLYRTPFVRNGRDVTLGYKPDIWKTWE